ncbi:MAG: hypothetical protein AAGA48_06360 [Myxococcota bacterium]
MNLVVLHTLLFVGAGCTGNPSAPEVPVSASEAPLQKAVDAWRNQGAVSGHFRAQSDAGVLMGRMARGQTNVLHITRGTFAYNPPDQFRVIGEQSAEFVGTEEPRRAAGSIDVLFNQRTLTMVSQSPAGIPGAPRVHRVGSDLFDESNPFKLKTLLNGSPFGQGDVAESVDAVMKSATFTGQQAVTEDGETLTAYIGVIDPAERIEAMVAEKSPGIAALLQSRKSELADRVFPVQLQATAETLMAQRHVRVLLDSEGWIRGWDAGPAQGRMAVSMRLNKLRRSVEKDAFILDTSLEAQAVDQTPALVAQHEALDKTFADTAAVAEVKAELLAAVRTLEAEEAKGEKPSGKP